MFCKITDPYLQNLFFLIKIIAYEGFFSAADTAVKLCGLHGLFHFGKSSWEIILGKIEESHNTDQKDSALWLFIIYARNPLFVTALLS